MADPPGPWAKFDIVAKAFAAVVLPVVIGVIGYAHNRAEKQASDRDLALRDSLGRMERRADRVAGLLDHLSSDNERRRRMAIRVAEELGVQGQLPAELIPVLKELALSGTDSAERAAASGAVQMASGGRSRRDVLIERLFDPSPEVRVAASQALVGAWRSDSLLVPALLDHATARLANANGVFNTLGVLAQVCPQGTRPHQARIAQFVQAVRAQPSTGPRILGLIDEVARCR